MVKEEEYKLKKLKIHNYQNKPNLYIFIIKIILFFSIFEHYNLIPSFIYSSAITLLNQNYFIIHKYGIDIYDPSFTQKFKNVLTFKEDEQIKNYESFSKTTISQFYEHDDIICLINDKIYIFNHEGELLYNTDKKIDELKGESYNLIIIKKDNNEYIYMTSFVNENNYIQLLFFKYEKNYKKNILIYKQPAFNFTQDGQSYLVKNKGLTCQLMTINSQSNILICIYFLNSYPNYLAYSLINPETYYFMEPIKNEKVILPIETNNIKYIKSTINSNSSKMFICLYSSSGIFYFYIYSIITNSISKYTHYNKKCKSYKCDIKFNYIKQNDQYLLSFPDNREHINIILFNNNFEKINNYTVDNYLYNFSYSILYYFSKKTYFIISDQSYQDLNYFFKKLKLKDNNNNMVKSSDEIKLRKTDDNFDSQREKCLDWTSESISRGLCISCNNDKNYYEINPNYTLKNSSNAGFVNCYNNSTKPKNFYLNKNYYEPCYMSCSTCEYGGDGNHNNCTACAIDYMNEPEVEGSNNCVIMCKNFYYYTSYGQFKCSSNLQCPEEKNLLIRDKKKCVDSCLKDDTFIYQYSGECIKECPTGTTADETSKICKVKNKEVCSKSSAKFDLYDFLKEGGVEKIAKTYVKEFNYTDKHISLFNNEVYSIMLYRTTECITELELSMPEIDFGSCYLKVQGKYNISNSLLVAIIDKKSNKKNNPITSYSFYNPITGEKLDSETVCNEEVIVVKENIKAILNDSVSDIESILFLTGQNINVFNHSSEFYTDLCYHFESPNNKDVALNDRLLVYYPNITLCDSGCQNKGVNLSSMTAICECKYKEMTEEEMKENIIYEFAIIEVYNILNQINLAVMACYKDIFDYNYFIKCTGGLILLCLIFIQLVNCIIYYMFSFFSVKKYIYNITDNYLLYLNKSPLYKPIINNIKQDDKEKKKEDEKSSNNKNFPPKKNPSTEDSNIDVYHNNKKLNNSKIKKIDNHKKMIKTQEGFEDKNNSKIHLCGQKLFTNKKRTKSNSNISNAKLEKTLGSFKSHEKTNTNPLTNNPNFLNKNNKNPSFYDQYLSTQLNEMRFNDALVNDKRLFFDYFCDKLKRKLLILEILLIDDPIKPKTLKVLFLILNIEVCFVINAMFINENYVSKLFRSTTKDNFFSFLPRSINRCIYSIAVSLIISYIIGCLFIEERRLKSIFRYEHNNVYAIKYEINSVMKEMKWRNNIFIIITAVISLFSWYYISCFNNVYPHMKIEWIKSSVFIMLILNFILIIVRIEEALLRFISFEIKSEKLYKASQWLR